MQSMANIVIDKLAISDKNFIGIFLYGSQNYHLGCDSSDTDAIMLIREAKKPKQEVFLSNGLVKVYTIKYFLYRLKQGDLECYEILYTAHRFINSLYEESFNRFVKNFSEHLNYDSIKAALLAKLIEHLDSVFWIPCNTDNSKYNKKRLYWAIRVCNQVQRIIEGESFKSSLVYKPTLDCDLLKIKTITNYLSLKELNQIYKYLVDYAKALPRFEKHVTQGEEICMSILYKELSDNNRC